MYQDIFYITTTNKKISKLFLLYHHRHVGTLRTHNSTHSKVGTNFLHSGLVLHPQNKKIEMNGFILLLACTKKKQNKHK